MKAKYFATLLANYVFWIFCFVVQKPLFMLFNPIKGVKFSDFLAVITHGLKLDWCFAAYFVFIPVLIFVLHIFISFDLKKILKIYNTIILALLSIIFAVDCVLFSYWGFHIDTTLLFYLRDFGESLNSVTFKDVLKFLLCFAIYFIPMLFIYIKTVGRLANISRTDTVLQKALTTLLIVLCLPILVVCTRGGISTATANVGMVYYCDNQNLNLAAVNPEFNLMYSLTKKENFSNKCRFYDDDFAVKSFNQLLKQDKLNNEAWLTNKRPNVVVILLESFSGRFIGAANGVKSVYEGKEVTPNLNAIAKQSITFHRAYSNGMRTDRGIVSVLSGFLAQPDMSIIKYPEKSSTLPSIAKTLSKANYNTEMIYGGDVNFANMRSYFYGSGYKNVIDYKSFSPKERMSKWGVNDRIMFDYLFKRINGYDASKPFFTTLLTLSSHEPFDVDFHKFKDKYVNSVAYTDDCLGQFLDKLKQSSLWNNTLIVLVADHASSSPEKLNRQDPELYHIPMLFTGGVISTPQTITTLVNQTDIAKTILSAMNLPTDDFIYSRDVLGAKYENYAFYVFTNGFGFITDDDIVVWDNDAKKRLLGTNAFNEQSGKILLQTLYKDIARR